MSILLWSLAVLDHDLDPGMLEGVAEYIKRQVAGFSAQGLSNSAWALTRFKAVPHGLLTLLAEEAEQRIADFTPQVGREMAGGRRKEGTDRRCCVDVSCRRKGEAVMVSQRP